MIEIVDEEIALGIEVRTDVVGDLAGVVAEPDALVEAGGAEPPGRLSVDVSGICQRRT